MEEVLKEIIQEHVKEEIVCVDMVINVVESLQPQVINSEPDDIKECNFERLEESVQVAYDKLIFGVEFMIVSSEPQQIMLIKHRINYRMYCVFRPHILVSHSR